MAQDKPLSEEEMERRLREDEVPDDELPEPPSNVEEAKGPQVYMQDEDPEKFAALMKEAMGETGTTPDAPSAEGEDPLKRIENLIIALPARIATALGVDE